MCETLIDQIMSWLNSDFFILSFESRLYNFQDSYESFKSTDISLNNISQTSVIIKPFKSKSIRAETHKSLFNASILEKKLNRKGSSNRTPNEYIYIKKGKFLDGIVNNSRSNLELLMQLLNGADTDTLIRRTFNSSWNIESGSKSGGKRLAGGVGIAGVAFPTPRHIRRQSTGQTDDQSKSYGRENTTGRSRNGPHLNCNPIE